MQNCALVAYNLNNVSPFFTERSQLTERSPGRATSSTNTQHHFEDKEVATPVSLAHPSVQRWIHNSVKKRDDACQKGNLS